MDGFDDLIIPASKKKSVNDIWEEAKLSIAKDITAISFDVWIKTLEPVDIIDDTLCLCASSTSGKNIILKNQTY